MTHQQQAAVGILVAAIVILGVIKLVMFIRSYQDEVAEKMFR